MHHVTVLPAAVLNNQACPRTGHCSAACSIEFAPVKQHRQPVSTYFGQTTSKLVLAQPFTSLALCCTQILTCSVPKRFPCDMYGLFSRAFERGKVKPFVSSNQIGFHIAATGISQSHVQIVFLLQQTLLSVAFLQNLTRHNEP